MADLDEQHRLDMDALEVCVGVCAQGGVSKRVFVEVVFKRNISPGIHTRRMQLVEFDSHRAPSRSGS